MPTDAPRDALDAQIDNLSDIELETHFASSGVSQGALKGLVKFYKKAGSFVVSVVPEGLR